MRSHAHGLDSYGRTFALAIALNVGFVLVEAFYGWRAHSLTLLAMGMLSCEALERLRAPVAVAGATVITVAAVGVFVISGWFGW